LAICSYGGLLAASEALRKLPKNFPGSRGAGILNIDTRNGDDRRRWRNTANVRARYYNFFKRRFEIASLYAVFPGPGTGRALRI